MRRQRLLAVVTSIFMGLGGWFAIFSCDAKQQATRIQNAVWVTTLAGPRLAVHEQLDRSSDDGSWTVERMILLDPLTGAPDEPWYAHFDGDERAVLKSARGGFLWFQVGFGSMAPYFLVPATGGKSVAVQSLESEYAAVPKPWYSVTVGGDGLISVEADDRTQWQIDVGNHTATPGATAPAGWRPSSQWDGLGFIDAPTPRGPSSPPAARTPGFSVKASFASASVRSLPTGPRW
jgi:hypothetical protein